MRTGIDCKPNSSKFSQQKIIEEGL